MCLSQWGNFVHENPYQHSGNLQTRNTRGQNKRTVVDFLVISENCAQICQKKKKKSSETVLQAIPCVWQGTVYHKIAGNGFLLWTSHTVLTDDRV